MDVVTDRDLLDFIDGLDVKEKDTSLDMKVCDKEEKEEDVWQDIGNLLDTESRHCATSENFRETIGESLRRQQLDGFLTDHDLTELRYITDLWTNLLNATSCYTVGCVFVKRDIMTHLLVLYSLRQITSSLFIETYMKL